MKLIKSFLLTILSIRSHFNILCLKIRGCVIAKSCSVSGSPYIRLRKGAKIIMEEHCTLVSAKWANRMINYPVTIDSAGADSRIIFRKHSGTSGSMFINVGVIDIGEYTTIGPGCTFNNCRAPHKYTPETGWVQLHPQMEFSRLIVGKRCFIGMNCIIQGGITIGDNCVIAAGSVITKDVPAGHFASGNPATYTPLPKALRKTPDGYVALGSC